MPRQPRTLPAGVTLVEYELPEHARTFRRGRGRPDQQLKGYEVFLDGVKIGRVYQASVTFDRKPAGSRIVTKRWQNVRWRYERLDYTGRTSYCETRVDAVLSLMPRADGMEPRSVWDSVLQGSEQ